MQPTPLLQMEPDRHVRLRESDYALLAGTLRQARIAADLTQKEVAIRLGTPQSFVSKYEAGERRLDLLELRHICGALNLTLSELLATIEATLGGAK